MAPGASPGLSRPSPLRVEDDVSAFDCGDATLNDWLRDRAGRSDGKTARTYVVSAGGRVIAYYSLLAGAVARATLPNARLRSNTPEQVPVVIIGRLAVDRGFHGKGIGSGLLRDAVMRAAAASQSIGIRAVLVHALSDDAMAFYRPYGFISSPSDHRILLLPIETAISALG